MEISRSTRIRNLAGFMNSLWDWSRYDTCFAPKNGLGDIDGVIERGGHVLIIECKSEGAQIPLGQKLTLRTLHRLGCEVCVVFGSPNDPKYVAILSEGDDELISLTVDNEWFKSYLSDWWDWASKNPKESTLKQEVFSMKGRIL